MIRLKRYTTHKISTGLVLHSYRVLHAVVLIGSWYRPVHDSTEQCSTVKKSTCSIKHCIAMQYGRVQCSTPQYVCSTVRSTVQYSTVQYSTVQYSTVQYRIVQFGTVQYSTVQYPMVQFGTVQYSTVQYRIVQFNTVQYSTVQYSTV